MTEVAGKAILVKIGIEKTLTEGKVRVLFTDGKTRTYDPKLIGEVYLNPEHVISIEYLKKAIS